MLSLSKLKRLRALLREEETLPPRWFVRKDPAAIDDPEPAFLYQSWIPEHTDKLIHLLGRGGSLPFQDIGMFTEPSDKELRKEIMRFAERQEKIFDRMVTHRLSQHRNTALGLIVTLDWVPAMRRLVYGASRLGLPTILVPHESVFAKQSMYYTHPKMGMNVPVCDLVLAWGDLQEQIFLSRGYPAERIIKVGAPKFDYLSSAAIRNGKGAARSLDLDPARPIVAFIAQPLDSQYDTRVARIRQNAAVVDLISIAKSHGLQVIVRLPPSRDNVLDAEVARQIEADPDLALDDPSLYILTAEETIAASDVVVSFNSTMLLEAALANKVAVASKYIEFDQIWDKLKIPVARSKDELERIVVAAGVNPERYVEQYDVQWAASAFGVGAFDGAASLRIQEVLNRVRAGALSINRGYAAAHPELLSGPAR